MTFMSSGHNPAHTKSITRRKADGSIIDVDCPLSITDYNQFMGGVDRGDQYRKYYHVRVKSRKSYKYIFWFLFEICVLNSFILSRYSPCTTSTPTYLSFRKQLAHELIGNYNSRRRHVISRTVIHHHLVVNTHHFPARAPTRRVCKRHSCNRQTYWYCGTCVKHLCHTGDHTTAQYNLYST